MHPLQFLLLVLLLTSSFTSSFIFNPVPRLRRPSHPLHASTYTVTLGLPPLGIVFEEVTPGFASGVVVSSLLPDSKASRCGLIRPGDRLLTTTAVKIESGTSKYSLVTVDATRLDFDSVVSAVGSHQERFRCDYVEMSFERPDGEGGGGEEAPDEP
mmetsp:Transcript_30126/g.59842  ORF Transcript_30126/g.59842 Transcript_30126/m.59842 type:complete len:156 (+) Transcript_30126:66-533(+)